MADLTIEGLDELDALHAKATPGEWRLQGGAGNRLMYVRAGTRPDAIATLRFVATRGVPREQRDADAQSIAALHNAWPSVSAMLRRERDEARASLSVSIQTTSDLSRTHLETAASLATARESVRELVDGLREARVVMALCGPSRERVDALRDRRLPEDAAVRSIAHLGYGAIMDAAARLWCDHLESQGLPWGAAHSTGPCVKTALDAVASIDALLAKHAAPAPTRRDRRTPPAWWNDTYRDDVLLYACAQAGMDAPEVIRQQHLQRAQWEKIAKDAVMNERPPVFIVRDAPAPTPAAVPDLVFGEREKYGGRRVATAADGAIYMATPEYSGRGGPLEREEGVSLRCPNETWGTSYPTEAEAIAAANAHNAARLAKKGGE